MALIATDDGFGLVRNTGPFTSEQAAADVNVCERKLQVCDALYALGEGTNEGIRLLNRSAE
jgi:hypothetical protein